MTMTVSPIRPIAAEAGSADDFEAIMATIDAAAEMLEATSEEGEALGYLAPEVSSWMREHRLASLMIPKDLGGYAMSPTQTISIAEKLTYHQASAGWVSVVHAGASWMCAGYLGKAGTDILFAPGTNTIICGAGAPTGVAEKVPGGYRVTGRWSYGSGIKFADYSHSGALLHIDGKQQFDEKGRPIILCVHPTTDELVDEGNWDVLGLQATGSVDYSYDNVFCPDELAYDFMLAEPQRDDGYFEIGPVGVAALGHASIASGIARRLLDEAAAFARTRSRRSDMAGQSDAFWEEFAKMEARVRAARAFLFEVWRDAEDHMSNKKVIPTRLHTLFRLASYEMHAAGGAAAEFTYKAGGGAALRKGVIQRLFREMYVAIQHLTVSPMMVRSCGRELMGGAESQVWRFYDLTDPD